MNTNIKYLVLICVFSTVHDQVLSFIVMRNNYQGTNLCAKESCSGITPKKRLGLSQFLDYLLGNNYYPGYQPGVGYPGQYPGNYPGNYPGHYGENPGLVGPPGAHPGCPLCDSSVYSYCNHKQAHDSCCCGGGTYFSCRSVDCKFLYANSCQEHNLISRCCCVDLQKNAPGQVPAVPVVAPVV